MNNVLDWAKREVKIACKKENPNRKEGEFDYGCACYESAIKAFESLCEDGHSGFSIKMTQAILVRLLDGQPLTPIEDTDDVWNKCSRPKDGPEVYQCKRMSSLFKDIYADEISKTIRQVSMRVAETQDEFIFQTLRDFGLSTSNIVVEKEELVQAIQLIRMMKEYGIDIFERYNTATAQAGIFRRGYKEGLHDGIEKERSKVMDILEKGE